MMSKPHQQSESSSAYGSRSWHRWSSHSRYPTTRSNTLPGLAPLDGFAAPAPASSITRSPLSNASSHSAMQPPPTQHPATDGIARPASSSDQASTEKEEGELSEDGGSNFASAPPRSSHAKKAGALHQTKARAASRSDLSTSAEGNQSSHDMTSQRERAKIFIESWNRSGFTFHQLTQEGFNPQILATLYEELGIPIEAPAQSSLSDTLEPATTELESSSTKQNNLAAVVSQADLSGAQPPGETPESASIAPQSDQSNRESYIARLMAVKGKRTTSEKPDAATQAASTSSQPQPSDHVDSNLPTPPVYSAALFSLNGLLRKLGLATSFFFEQTREQCFSVDLRIRNFPKHLQPHLHGALAMETDQDQPAKCLGADISLESDSVFDTKSTLRIRQQEFQSKKLAKQGAARVAFTVITAAVEGHEQQPTSSAHHDLESDDPQSSTTAPTKHSRLKDSDDGQGADEASTSEVVVEASRDATTPIADTSSDARKKAQTELLRQKMEALKLAKLQAAQAADASALDNPAPNDTGSPSSAGSTPSNAFEQSLDPDNIASSTTSNSKIPGLFMTAPADVQPASPAVGFGNNQSDHQNVSSIPSLLEVPSAATRSMRKRPVAADFNDDVESPITKRPFGQIRGGDGDEAIIIEASDDEYEFDVDLNSKSPGLKSGASSVNAIDHPSFRKLANSGPLRSLGAENSYQLAGRAQTPVGGSNGFDKRQKEIVEMKKKIAAMEAKRKAKLYSSRPSTPSSGPGSGVQAESTEQNLPSSDQLDSALAQQQQQLSAGSSPHPSAHLEPSSKHLHPYQIGEKASTVETKNSAPEGPLEWKHRRRTEIKSNLPALEASFEDDSRELERLRLQMERVQDDMKRKQENKKRLIEELESLGVDTDGMAHSELQATKDLLDQREQNENINNNIESLQTHNSPLPDAAENSSRSSMSISSPEEPNSVPLILNNSGNAGILGGSSSVPQQTVLDGNAHESRNLSDSDESNLYPDDKMDDTIQKGATLLPSQPYLEQEEPADTPVGNSTGSSAHFADNESMSSTGSSVEKADSRSLMLPENEDIEGPLNANYNSGHHEAPVAAEESDDYEPSDPWEAEPPSNVADTASPVNVGKDTESSQMDESEDAYEPTDYYGHSEKQTPGETSFIPEPEAGTNDLASEIQGSLEHDQDLSQLDSAKKLPPGERFTQYRSALKYFKSHSGSAPSDGEAHSASVSHRIDHQREICPFELAGGVCNDEKCHHQHFRSMNIEGEYRT